MTVVGGVEPWVLWLKSWGIPSSCGWKEGWKLDYCKTPRFLLTKGAVQITLGKKMHFFFFDKKKI